MTRKDRAQIVAYIDAKVTYVMETLQGDFKTSESGRSVLPVELEEARETLLTGKKPKPRPKKKSRLAGPTTYAPGDHQWENPAYRSE
jgi:hypothetical protein